MLGDPDYGEYRNCVDGALSHKTEQQADNREYCRIEQGFYAAGGEVRLQSAIGQKWAKRADGQAEAN